jgi:lysophospholipase L1-like esterase
MPSRQVLSAASSLLWIFALGASMAVPTLAGGDKNANCRPEVWKDAIEAFEKQDARNPPHKQGILFVGSSSIRMWDLKKSFPDLPVINRGFGGSQICDATHYAEQLVIKHQPRVVVLYAGDNDIAAGKKSHQVQHDFREFVKMVQKGLPDTRIVFISIKPSVARWKLAEKMRKANGLIKSDCKKDEKLVFVDVWEAMLEGGRPRKDLLRDDGLHMNDDGYAIWTKLVRPKLEADEESNHDDTTGTTTDK